jgi:SOS-response transcriptional repressor LexA
MNQQTTRWAIFEGETGGEMTAKKRESDKNIVPDGTCRHTRIRLASLNPKFKAIIIPEAGGEKVKIIAVLVEVLKVEGQR